MAARRQFHTCTTEKTNHFACNYRIKDCTLHLNRETIPRGVKRTVIKQKNMKMGSAWGKRKKIDGGGPCIL
jgi:hypothetical protein